MDWTTFLLLMLILIVNGQFAIFFHEQRKKRRKRDRDKQFLRAMVVEYPNAKLSFIAIESSDEVAMARLEKQIRENRYQGPTRVTPQ